VYGWHHAGLEWFSMMAMMAMMGAWLVFYRARRLLRGQGDSRGTPQANLQARALASGSAAGICGKSAADLRQTPDAERAPGIDT